MDTDTDAATVAYQFEMPREDWRRWTDTVPRSQPLDARLAALIRQDARFRGHAPDSDTVTWEFEIDRETWDAWLDLKADTATIHDHLRNLLVEDIQASDGDGWDDMEEKTARLLATRMFHRAETAATALSNGDNEKVREELDQIKEIAELFEE